MASLGTSQLTLTKIGKYELLKPITFGMDYLEEYTHYVLYNAELSLFGCGPTKDKAIEDLESEIVGHVLSFTLYPDEAHTRESLVLSDRLKEHVDFGKVFRSRVTSKISIN